MEKGTCCDFVSFLSQNTQYCNNQITDQYTDHDFTWAIASWSMLLCAISPHTLGLCSMLRAVIEHHEFLKYHIHPPHSLNGSKLNWICCAGEGYSFYNFLSFHKRLNNICVSQFPRCSWKDFSLLIHLVPLSWRACRLEASCSDLTLVAPQESFYHWRALTRAGLTGER